MSELQSRQYLVCRLFLLLIRRPPISTLFPYTTLFDLERWKCGFIATSRKQRPGAHVSFLRPGTPRIQTRFSVQEDRSYRIISNLSHGQLQTGQRSCSSSVSEV